MKDDEEKWKKKLTPKQYKVLRKKGTELPFTGKFIWNKKEGSYFCAACGNKIFDSKKKFRSFSGWPSFYDAVKGSVKLKEDTGHGMKRVEVVCKKCGGHLGHVFDDGPKPTGKRYCINSCAMEFKNEKRKQN